jgi:hypothetical protein
MGADIFVMEISHSLMLFLAAFRINTFRLVNESPGGPNLIRDQVSLALYAQSTAAADEVE